MRSFHIRDVRYAWLIAVVASGLLAFAFAKFDGLSVASLSQKVGDKLSHVVSLQLASPVLRSQQQVPATLAVWRHRPFRLGAGPRRLRRALSGCCPRSWEENKSPQEQTQPLFDGKTLAGWAITQFGPQGEVAVKDGNLVLGFGDGCTGVTWKGDFPKVNFEVQLEAQRVDGSDFFCGMTFPVQDEFCSFIVGGWGGGLIGLSSLNGDDAANNQTARYKEFEEKRWYKIRVRVSEPKIECWIDDEKVVDLRTDRFKFSVRPEVELSRPFGISSWCTTAALRNIKLRKVSGPDTPVDPDDL